MSTREIIKNDIDIMPDYVINAINGILIAFKTREAELEEEKSFWQAVEDSENGNVFGPFDTPAEAIASMLEE
jgi:hypothetical protein